MDITTLVLILAIGNGVSATIFISYIFGQQNKKDSIKLFAIGKLLQTLTWVIFLINQNNLNPIYMTIGNTFQYFGLLAEVIGIIYAIKGKNKKLIYFGSIFVIVSLIVFAVFSKSIPIRALISSTVFTLLYSYLFITTSKQRNISITILLVALFSIVFAGSHFVRAIMAVCTNHKMEIFTNNTIQGILGIVYITVTFTFPIFLLLIETENDNNELKLVNATKTKFFRIIGHDLKAPFNQLYNISQLIEMQKECIDAKQLEKLSKTIAESSNRTSKLLDDLLTWAKVDSKEIQAHPKRLTVNKYIADNINLIKHRTQQKDIVIINKTLPDHEVYCDSNLFNTIIRNILSNAVKFSYVKGVITISSSIENNNCVVSIKDNGVGIPNDKNDQIFKIDSDYSTLGTSNEKGTGVGLSLCKELIEISNGEIWFESLINQGTTFNIRLPI